MAASIRILFVLVILSSITFTVHAFFFHSTTFRTTSSSSIYNHGQYMMNTAIAPVVGHVDIKIVSLNVLAPCYNNVKIDGVLICESEREDLYLSRHENICKHLQQTQADVICIQEFWLSSEKIKKLYIHMLCETYGYIKKSLRRTSHWRTRDDGLAVFVKNDTIEIQDCQNILFHDCGDRVAMLLLLAIRPSSILHHHVLPHSTNIEPLKPQQFIVINTHLLFPHNTYSTNIRLREATKILGFAELYRQRELCTTICNRADIRLPVIVTGDFNGSPRGKVHKFFESQNFHSAVDEYMKHNNKSHWVSHKSHKKTLVAVDHLFYSNPSQQTHENLPPVPDWTNLVFREVFQTILERYGVNSLRQAFSDFDVNKSSYINREDFKQAIITLGYMGEGTPSLTPEEIEALVVSADYDGNGKIDYSEFVDRFDLASNNEDFGNAMRDNFLRAKWLNDELVENEIDFEFILPKKEGITDSNIASRSFVEASVPVLTMKTDLASIIESSRPLGDLVLKSMHIFPSQLEDGIWPIDYTLSDHGIIEAVFTAQLLGPIPEDEAINPVPVARKRTTA